MTNVTIELQKTLIDNPNIETVYFDASGRHYFYAHLLKKGKDDEDEPQLYGQGEYSHSQIIPGAFNVDKTTEAIAKGVKETLIVDEMSRQEVLDVKVEEKSDAIFNDILNLPPDKLAMLKALLSSTSTETKEPQVESDKKETVKKQTVPTPAPTPNNK